MWSSLRALVATDPTRAGDDVATHAGSAPAPVGASENLAAARARMDLADGRAVTLVLRRVLEQASATPG